MSGRTVLRIAGDSPWKRGHERGRRARDEIARAWGVYAKLFETVAAGSGLTLDVPALAAHGRRDPRVGTGAGRGDGRGRRGPGGPFWTIAALNARTEILAEAGAPRAGECSTLVHSGTRTTGGQCWDWHEGTRRRLAHPDRQRRHPERRGHHRVRHPREDRRQ
ncbi:hypothetical protein ACLB9X_03555 [Streptomyces sp. 5K101]|uniref:hypothetical protein n=1 Tax=Streptomyces sp. 5K101 TaxID=3390037 RepID=UPI003976F07A